MLLLVIVPTYGQIPEDKKKHFIAGAVIAIPPNFFTWQMSDSKKPKLAFWVGMAVATGAGIYKEATDEDICKCWDNEDLLATMLGGASTSIPLYFWQRSIVRKKERKRLQTLKNLSIR